LGSGGFEYGLDRWVLLKCKHSASRAASCRTRLNECLFFVLKDRKSGKVRANRFCETALAAPRISNCGVDRHFYELCALAELRDRLRSGDIVEWLGEPEPKGPGLAKPSVKQQLAAPRRAALRLLFEWLVVGHVLDLNPVFKSREHEPGR
jgi:hypothetical protein